MEEGNNARRWVSRVAGIYGGVLPDDDDDVVEGHQPSGNEVT